jgi:hypothetical protein
MTTLYSAVICTGLDAIGMTALLLSPLGTELLSLILDQPFITHQRRQAMTEATNPKIDLVQTTCPMCNQRIFEAVLRHTIDGAVMASPEMQTEARRLIADHERTCSGNH